MFTELTEYRLYEDLRRGWRVVHPNLEQVGCCRSSTEDWRSSAGATSWPSFTRGSPVQHRKTRMASARRHPRLSSGASSPFGRGCWRRPFQQQLRRRAEQHLNEFWGLDPDYDELRQANGFVRPGSSSRQAEGFGLGERSLIGRFLRTRLEVSRAYGQCSTAFWTSW
ncbi:MAG: hypothetical protein KatS3mg102_0336 [Planctomycetota bacterium]|nr:MAG: hypothetical protein KatS3mg102_0336 [Planctomycetota bacterium]